MYRTGYRVDQNLPEGLGCGFEEDLNTRARSCTSDRPHRTAGSWAGNEEDAMFAAGPDLLPTDKAFLFQLKL